MSKINLTLAHNEDWKSFLSSDDKKRHWINQRILEDERDLEETEQPEPKPYVKQPKEKVNPLKDREDARNCKLLWDLTNGITLCKRCHCKKDKRKYTPDGQGRRKV